MKIKELRLALQKRGVVVLRNNVVSGAGAVMAAIKNTETTGVDAGLQIWRPAYDGKSATRSLVPERENKDGNLRPAQIKNII